MTLLTLLLVAGSLQGQTILQKIATDRISCDYTYETLGTVKVKSAGQAVLQGDCYRIGVNGMELYCDGETLWTVDPDAKEVYVEPAQKVDIIHLFLQNARNVTYTSDTVKGTYTDPADGVDIAFSLSGITYEEASEDLSLFRFAAEKEDPGYIVTDLR